jgi:hypothetical protein
LIQSDPTSTSNILEDLEKLRDAVKDYHDERCEENMAKIRERGSNLGNKNLQLMTNRQTDRQIDKKLIF